MWTPQSLNRARLSGLKTMSQDAIASATEPSIFKIARALATL
jgi:hypothetical protein